MELFELDKELRLCCVTARSFPHDIGKAFDELIKKLPGISGRNFFGISYQTAEGTIVYKASVLESYTEEYKMIGCELYTVEKGTYITQTIRRWRKDPGSIGLAFKELADSRTDTDFPCVEWYKGRDVVCMIRLQSEKIRNTHEPDRVVLN